MNSKQKHAKQKKEYERIKALKILAQKDPKLLTFAERNILNIINKKSKK